jgi:hypothetical protein
VKRGGPFALAAHPAAARARAAAAAAAAAAPRRMKKLTVLVKCMNYKKFLHASA